MLESPPVAAPPVAAPPVLVRPPVAPPADVPPLADVPPDPQGSVPVEPAALAEHVPCGVPLQPMAVAITKESPQRVRFRPKLLVILTTPALASCSSTKPSAQLQGSQDSLCRKPDLYHTVAAGLHEISFRHEPISRGALRWLESLQSREKADLSVAARWARRCPSESARRAGAACADSILRECQTPEGAVIRRQIPRVVDPSSAAQRPV